MIHHIGFEVADLERSITFYEKWFGFGVEQRVQITGEEIVFLEKDGDRIELIQSTLPVSHASSIHLAFAVADVAHMVSLMQEQGVEVLEPITTHSNGWTNVFVAGPDGEWVELIANG